MKTNKIIIGGTVLAALGVGAWWLLREESTAPPPGDQINPLLPSNAGNATQAPGRVSNWAEGTLMRAGGEPEVYQIDAQGYRRHATGAYFARMGYSMTNVLSIPKSQMEAIPKGLPLMGVSSNLVLNLVF